VLRWNLNIETEEMLEKATRLIQKLINFLETESRDNKVYEIQDEEF
jgi:hypothetical protein